MHILASAMVSTATHEAVRETTERSQLRFKTEVPATETTRAVAESTSRATAPPDKTALRPVTQPSAVSGASAANASRIAVLTQQRIAAISDALAQSSANISDSSTAVPSASGTTTGKSADLGAILASFAKAGLPTAELPSAGLPATGKTEGGGTETETTTPGVGTNTNGTDTKGTTTDGTGATGATGSTSELSGDSQSVRLALLVQLLERATGRSMKWLKPADLQVDPNTERALEAIADALAPLKSTDATASTSAASTDSTASPTGGTSAPAGTRWSMDVQVERSTREAEKTTFGVAGTIQTADGRSISISANFSMERERVTVNQFSAGATSTKDPLALLFSGSTPQLSNKTVQFDLNGDGVPDEAALGLQNGAYLAVDRNGNGTIDDGREVLGATSGNGFAELKSMDQDGNGFVDEGDQSYSSLRLWKPGDDALPTLAESGVGALWTGNQSTPFELRDTSQEQVLGRVRSTGIYLTESGDAGALQQIDVKA